MPAKYPRLTITMRPGLHAMLQRLSELTGQSQSGLIFELLDGAEPVLHRVIKLIETAELAKEDLRGKLARDMQGAQARIERQLALTLDDLGESDVPALLDQAEPGPARRRRKGVKRSAAPASAPQATPLSNRGVRSLTTTVQKPSKVGSA